jgi:hypothetical protein
VALEAATRKEPRRERTPRVDQAELLLNIQTGSKCAERPFLGSPLPPSCSKPMRLRGEIFQSGKNLAYGLRHELTFVLASSGGKRYIWW